MGGVPSKPTEEEFGELRSRMDATCRKVAENLWRSDVLLLCTGAGFSADSGLAVYKDIAELEAYQDLGIRYHDICRPEWLRKDPELFYGFWGTCYNDYRETQPHEGYDLLRRWRGRFAASQADEAVRARQAEELLLGGSEAATAPRDSVGGFTTLREDCDPVSSAPIGGQGQGKSTKSQSSSCPYRVDGWAGAFFVFTSNVDAHSFDYFEPREVREVHGNTEVWQCGALPRPCCKRTWRAPLNWRFLVDQQTMRAPCKEKAANGHGGGQAEAEDIADTGNAGQTNGGAKPAAPQGKGKNGATGQRVKARGESKNTEPQDTAKAGRVHRPFGQRRAPLTNLPRVSEDDVAGFPVGTNRPRCPYCGGPARPAILMFNDLAWVSDEAQEKRWSAWRRAVSSVAHSAERFGRRLRVLILEIGCGANVPTVRHAVEHVAADFAEDADVTVVRINPDFPLPDKLVFPSGHMRHLSLPCRGLEALRKIQEHYEGFALDGRLAESDEPLQLSDPRPSASAARLAAASRSRSRSGSPARAGRPRELRNASAASRSRSRSRSRSSSPIAECAAAQPARANGQSRRGGARGGKASVAAPLTRTAARQATGSATGAVGRAGARNLD